MDHWLSVKELMEMTGVGETKARIIIRAVNKELEDNGYFIISRSKAPRKIVLQRLGVEPEEK